MPYPQNVAMATEVEGIVREHGAVPATIAILDGRLCIGLSPDQLELLASDGNVTKVSVRDLPYVVARGQHGATTVAATMRLAAMAGIRTFVTGGLGGVHRGAQQTFDVSADLTELGQTSVAVVSRRREVASSTSASPSRPWRRWACRCSGSAATSSRRSTPAPAATPPRCASTPRPRSPP